MRSNLIIPGSAAAKKGGESEFNFQFRVQFGAAQKRARINLRLSEMKGRETKTAQLDKWPHLPVTAKWKP